MSGERATKPLVFTDVGRFFWGGAEKAVRCPAGGRNNSDVKVVMHLCKATCLLQ